MCEGAVASASQGETLRAGRAVGDPIPCPRDLFAQHGSEYGDVCHGLAGTLARVCAQGRAQPYCGPRRLRSLALFSMTPRRLQRSRDIRDVFSARNVVHGRLMTVHAVRRAVTELQGTPPKYGDDQARVAVIAGKDMGGAVQRNRAKRRLRAALAAESCPLGFDIVVRVRPVAADADFGTLRAELADLIGRAVSKANRAPIRTGGSGGRRA